MLNIKKKTCNVLVIILSLIILSEIVFNINFRDILIGTFTKIDNADNVIINQ
jgi:hypothetical protein